VVLKDIDVRVPTNVLLQSRRAGPSGRIIGVDDTSVAVATLPCEMILTFFGGR
jgi:hypothetical protein